ncbi:hypothetical protein KZ483_14280 [Paenibacillus sp. sptzw28]|uniref:hypothetical protein n=1 Tax=Paenibacillus sp. sptzw28 TaxID=715179 RepID=UPI001C6F5A3E|nr:hypothetical protein [Paenibacillus sp. sptzw28]QYR19138.1 hypothetical protein KZ483_14280 [Paenibacillus sp. sptzw28]
MNRLAGLLLMGFSCLTAAIIFTLAKMSQNVDEIDGNFGGWSGQIPSVVFIFLIIPLLIGVRLLNKRDSDK